MVTGIFTQTPPTTIKKFPTALSKQKFQGSRISDSFKMYQIFSDNKRNIEGLLRNTDRQDSKVLKYFAQSIVHMK